MMPDGLVQWYDDGRGEGRIVRGGRRYAVRAADMEPRARVPGARVHFDIRRHAGVPEAVDVRLREGTRVSRRQRRFGDMVGARRPDTRGSAPFARPHPELGRRLGSDPLSPARRWAECVAANDLVGAALLLAPDAVVHAGHRDLRGRRLRGWLAAGDLPGHLRSVETAGAGAFTVLRWLGPDGRPATAWARVAHGEVAELWIGGARPPTDEVIATSAPGAEPAIEIVARGPEAEAAASYAEEKVRRVMDIVSEPILHARVKLRVAPDPAVERPARAQATLDVNGQLVRAHVAAHSLREAVDLLEQRLRSRLERRADEMRTLHRRAPAAEAAGWRHGAPPSVRRPGYDRPPDERQVVRRKTFALDELTLDEAAFDMEMLDLDFYLFRELATGGDAVLHRLADDRLGLRRLEHSPIAAVGEAVEVELEPGSAPDLALDDALDWLDLAGVPFVFFRALETGRAAVAYRRDDGHDGLITPADEPASPAEPSTARRRLRAELDRLETVRAALLHEALAAEIGTTATTSSIEQPEVDVGTEVVERGGDLSMLDVVDREVADLQRALVRVDRGTYGRCEACGAPIPDERLSATPAARFCPEHQAAAESPGGPVT